EKQRASLFAFDEEDLRPYFPLDQVVQGMFRLTERLFDIQVVEEQGVPVWDPAVRFYWITSGGKRLGGFYTDWFPRENKRGGAWMDAFIAGSPAQERPHLA